LTYFPSHETLYHQVKSQYDKLVQRLEKYISNEGTAKNAPGKYKALVSKLQKQSEPSIFHLLRELEIKELLKLVEMESTNKEEQQNAKLTQQYDEPVGKASKKKKTKKKRQQIEEEEESE